jgi:ferredoxin
MRSILSNQANANRALLDCLSNICPDFITGAFELTGEILSEVPAAIRNELAEFKGWSVFVFALPIKDEAFWIWHKAGDTRLLFANYFLLKASLATQEMLKDSGVGSIDVASAFGEKISMTELGERAGLGTRGLNNLLLHPVYGSWLQIHALLINQKLQVTERLDYSVCTKCNKCISACPAKALEPERFHRNRCSMLVASPWLPRSRALALTENSYIECAECITSCPIGQEPERLFAWQR